MEASLKAELNKSEGITGSKNTTPKQYEIDDENIDENGLETKYNNLPSREEKFIPKTRNRIIRKQFARSKSRSSNVGQINTSQIKVSK